MKRLLFAIFCILCCGVCNSAQIVNVEYIHKLIEQEYGITVPYNSNLTNPQVAANMKYLLTTIDAANSILNGEQITDYGNSEYATTVATDTVATIKASETLIDTSKFVFNVITKNNINTFSFNISAAGTFYIYWGDNTFQTINKQNTESETITHNFSKANKYKIRIGGKATAYNTSGTVPAIQFINNVQNIEGSLGQIFSTLSDGTQPIFYNTFSGCGLSGMIPETLFKGIIGQPVDNMFSQTFQYTNITQIPDGLFADIQGTPTKALFNGTFKNTAITNLPENLFSGIKGVTQQNTFHNTFNACSKLVGPIPENLFASIYGQPAGGAFERMFANCTNLSGPLPPKLFAGIKGKPSSAFSQTFYNCKKLTGEIPEKFFGEISGETSGFMFWGTFNGCSGLTGTIPENLFGDIYGSAKGYMFLNTFTNCSGLTGPSAKINGQYLYEIWPDATNVQVGSMYSGATGLTDYADIPSPWK